MRYLYYQTISIGDGGEFLANVDICGISGETKPTEGICTGSRFLEVDTGIEYRFEEESKTWFAQGSGNGKTSIAGATVTLGSAVTYDGTEKTKTVSSVKLGATTLVADTDYTVQDNKATEIGDYTLYIVGKGSYTGVIAEAWSIGLGVGSVTASPDSLELTDTAGTSTLTVVGDGEVSVASASESVATATVDGTTVTITPVGAGSTTVTVTLAATDHYSGGTDEIAVTVSEG